MNEPSISKRRTNLPIPSQDLGGTFEIEHSTVFQKVSLPILKLTWTVPVAAGVYAVLNYYNATEKLAVSGIIGCTLALILFCSYLFLAACLLKNKFILRQWGITLPLIYLGIGRLSWSWTELASVTFSRSDKDLTAADQVVLRFQDPDYPEPLDVNIKLKDLEQVDLKKLIYAIVTNAPHAVIEPALDKVALEFPTVSGIKHLNFQSFTNVWDEEFSTRYSPTLFVPLSPSDELRGGSIKIEELVACGGSAAIYSATDSSGTKIIVKEAVIPKNSPQALKDKAIELFTREALLLSKLDHPNIAKVFDHFVENEHHYEILEYIDGLDLRRFVIERGPQPEDFVLNWAQQICEILVYLHSQEPPVIHRDLTPDNLVLRVDGQLVLIDFGAANAFVGTATGTMVGKQSYMPPEQLRGKAVPQSDIFSLGATCYFLLTGKDPTPLEVSQISEKSDLPRNLNPLLARCTATEISDRYGSSAELLAAIQSLRQQRVIEASLEVSNS